MITPEVGRLAAVHVRRLSKPATVQATLGISVDGTHWCTGAPQDALYEIGSITKVFTTTLLALMVDDGSVSLEDTAVSHLPHLALDARITLVQLATHTSGLPRVPKELLQDPTPQDPYARFDETTFLNCLGRARVRGTPGKRFAYSNLGSALLGYLLAQRAQQSYAQLIDERICRPLGLRDTAIEVEHDQRARLLPGHDRRGRPTPHWNLASFAPAGGLKATADDLLTFADAQMVAVHPQSAAFHRARAIHHRSRSATLGLGWFLSPMHGATEVWHTGGTGGAASYVGFVPASNIAVVVVVNRGPSLRDVLLWNAVERIGRKTLARLVALRRSLPR